MKGTKKALCLLAVISVFACSKSNDNASQISLTPSATLAKVGDTVSVVLSSSANLSNWTVSPSSSATKTFGITTSKINYFTFSQPGTYTVAVRVYDTDEGDTLHQLLDSSWIHSGGNTGSCRKGIDTASVSISITGK